MKRPDERGRAHRNVISAEAASLWIKVAFQSHFKFETEFVREARGISNVGIT